MNKALVDLATQGKFSPYRPIGRTDPIIRRPNYHYNDSPDGKYAIDLIQQQGSAQISLYLVNVQGKDSRLLQDKLEYLKALTWSPDSARLAFLWFSRNIFKISVVDVDTSENRVVFQSAISPTLLKWSVDHLYLAMSVSAPGGGNSRSLQFWSQQGLITLRPHTNIYDSYEGAVQWSPVGHRLLYQGWNGNSIFIGLASPETATEETWPWQQNSGLVVGDWSWSPNGRYMGLFNLSGGTDKTNWYAILYRMDGADAVKQVMRIDGGDLPLAPRQDADPQWIDNGESLAFLRSENLATQDDDSNLSISLEIYHLDTGKHESLFLGDSLELPYASSQRRFVALQSRQNGKQALDILDVVTRNLHSIVTDADDVEPYWSPDGQTIAVVWTNNTLTNRAVHLTWASADGANPQELIDNFGDVQTLVWLDKNRALAFVTEREGVYGVETVDLDTGTHHQLVDGMVQVLNLQQDPENDLIAFWWRDKSNGVGTSGFEATGKQIYQFKGYGPGAILSAGLFWSPDHHVAALKMRFKDQETIQLASPDGSWSSLLRDGLSGLGDPLWSPDSTQVAYTLAVNRGPVLLEVYSSAGQKIRLLDYPHQSYSQLVWSQCR